MPQNPGSQHAFAPPVPFQTAFGAVTAGGLVRRTSRLGVAALILGLLTVAVGWLPVIGLVMLVPALIGLGLALAGVAKATLDRRDGRAPTSRRLPLVAAALCAFGIMLPPVSTVLAFTFVAPWAWQVGLDHAEIEWRHGLVQNDVDPETAHRISAAVVGALRPLGDVRHGCGVGEGWRTAIRTLHGFELVRDDYKRALRRQLGAVRVPHLESAELASPAAERFDHEVRTLARQVGVELSEGDLSTLIDALKLDVVREVDRWRQWNRSWDRPAGYRWRGMGEEAVRLDVGLCPGGAVRFGCGV